MLSQKKLQALAQKVLKSAKKADQAEVIIASTSTDLTRFANNEIHQNISSDQIGISLRLVVGKKIGVASSDLTDNQGIKNLVQKAFLLTKFQKPDPEFISLPSKRSSYKKVQSFADNTAKLSAAQRADAVALIVSKAKENQLTASGKYLKTISHLTIANSQGIRAFQASSQAELSTIVMGNSGSGYAAATAVDSAEIDPEGIANTAVHKATFGGQPSAVKPGEWEVILEPAALAELLDFYVMYGPNARIFHEDVSFLQHHMNKPIFSKLVTLTDDPLDSNSLPQSFDFEGVAKKPLTLIKKGQQINIAYDSYYAKKYKKVNTAHALPAPNVWGPMPSHLKLQPGRDTLQQLIKSTQKGLLVTRFWYIRLLHPKLLNLTGMTRDGLFLIKNGQIVSRVKNLRFTESVPHVLKNIVQIDNQPRLVGSEGFHHLLPSVKVEKFTFTSSTKFS